MGPLRAGELPAVATALADGLSFSPAVMTNVLAGRIAAGTAPLLLVARRPSGPCPEEIVGAALLDAIRPVAGGRLFTRVGVPEVHRGLGVGRLLTACLRDALPAARPPLSVEIDSADKRSVEIGMRWGLTPYQRSLRLQYDLPAPGRAGSRSVTHNPSLAITALSAASTEADWRAAFELYATVSLDLPDRAGAPAPDYTVFRSQLTVAEGISLARLDGRLVGISAASPSEDGLWYVFLTGTLRAVRRTGVARALKAAVHATAIEHGARAVGTSTLESNTAMLTLNRSLGYRVVGGISRFEM